MRGKPFEPGNKLGKGRKPGSRNKKTKLLESLQHQRPVFASDRSLEGLLPGFEKCVFPLDLTTIDAVLEANRDVHLECKRYIERYENAVQDNAFMTLVKSVARDPVTTKSSS